MRKLLVTICEQTPLLSARDVLEPSLISRRFNHLIRLVIAISLCLGSGVAANATLYVIVLNDRGIAIAADSRRILLEGKQTKTIDGVEKVIRLGARMAFMSSGLTEFSGVTSNIQPRQIVTTCYASLLRDTPHVPTKDLATAYAKLMTEKLNNLSEPEKVTVESVLRQLGVQNNQMMESLIVGIDGDGMPKVETVQFYLSRPSSAHSDLIRFESRQEEAIATGIPRVILSGDVAVLKGSFENGDSQIAQLPSVQAWSRALQEGKQVDPIKTAEALLDLAIKYAPPEQIRLGYPIFVYTLDATNGLKKIRTVLKGKAVDLPN
jgi:hypothetical protein